MCVCARKHVRVHVHATNPQALNHKRITLTCVCLCACAPYVAHELSALVRLLISKCKHVQFQPGTCVVTCVCVFKCVSLSRARALSRSVALSLSRARARARALSVCAPVSHKKTHAQHTRNTMFWFFYMCHTMYTCGLMWPQYVETGV
jgi:hypothetical protein